MVNKVYKNLTQTFVIVKALLGSGNKRFCFFLYLRYRRFHLKEKLINYLIEFVRNQNKNGVIQSLTVTVDNMIN